jgi:sortase A
VLPEREEAMMKPRKLPIDKLFVLIGIAMIAVAAIVLISWQWGIHASQRKVESYVHTIRTLIPEPQGAVLEERRDNTMSVLSVEGTNFSGILEMPRFGSALPVCADWGEVAKYPCCLSGSVYDRTIQIGGTTQRGQYDFYREISVGDAVFFTDMEGNRFSYEVVSVRYEKHADQNALQKEDADLTLFIKNTYAFEYIVIFCNALG